MAIGDVYQLSMFQLYAGQQIMNTLAFERKTAPDPSQLDAADLAQDWMDQFRQHQLVGLTHTGWRLQQLRGAGVSYATDCRRTGGLLYEGAYNPPSVGTHTGADGMPPQSAVVTTLRTAFSGRTRRGRFYLAGWSEVQQNNGTIVPLFVTELTTSWGVQMAQYGPTGTDPQWRIGVWSMRIATGCAPGQTHPHAMQPVGSPNPGDAFRPLVATTVRTIVYSQRRRTIGVGQ